MDGQLLGSYTFFDFSLRPTYVTLSSFFSFLSLGIRNRLDFYFFIFLYDLPRRFYENNLLAYEIRNFSEAYFLTIHTNILNVMLQYNMI